MKITLLFLFFTFSAHAEVPEGVFVQLGKFNGETGVPLSKEYIKKFSELVEHAVESSQKNVSIPHEFNCKPTVLVEQSNILTDDTDPTVREFEAGLIRIEVLTCLPKADSSSVLKILASPSFRKASISTIQQTYTQNGNQCEITHAPTLGQSNYCFEIQSSFTEKISKTKSYNVWNSPDFETYNVPIYYRGIFETAIQTKNQTVYHMVTYIRANRFNLMQRMFVRKYIVSVETAVLLQLTNALK